MEELECPYCEKKQEASPDIHEPHEDHEHECEGCGKTFVYEIEYSPYYYERKADCLNGGDHDWQKVFGTVRGMRKCRGCKKYWKPHPKPAGE